MLNNGKIKFLLNEVASLKSRNIIEDSVAEKITEYYKAKMSPKNIAKLILISLSIFAALLIIGGVTLVVVTFNWNIFTKEVKTVCAFLLLIIPQALSLVQLLKENENLKKKETFSLVLALFFGISVAFIGQIFRLPDNIESFLLMWLISTIFIIYIFNSISSTVLYSILLISYTSVIQASGKIGIVFYPLLALLIPFYITEYRKKTILRTKIFDYFLIITIISGLGITLEKVIPGLWIIAYANLFVLFYLYGILFEKNDRFSLFYSPFKIAGILGVAFFAYLLTFHWPWESIGWNFYRTEERFNFAASMFDYFLCIVLPIASAYLFYLALIRKKILNYILCGFGILNIFIYVIVSSLYNSGSKGILLFPAWAINLFVVAYCLYFFYVGYKNKSLITVNASTIFLIALLLTRFFSFDMGILSRGFAFIGLGIILVIVNFVLSKKFKRMKS